MENMTNILEQLEKKPKPETKQKIQVQVDEIDETKETEQKDDVETEDSGAKKESKPVPILDERDKGFDRQKFLQRIQSRGIGGIERDIAPMPVEEKPEVDTKPRVEDTSASPSSSDSSATTDSSATSSSSDSSTVTDSSATSSTSSSEEEEEKTPETKPKKIIIKKPKTNATPSTTQPLQQAEEGLQATKDAVSFGKTIEEQLPKRRANKENAIVGVPYLRANTYYRSNREKFIQFVNRLFEPYKQELAQLDKESVSCDSRSRSTQQSFSLMTHQKIVRDYLANYTPYRGLLLYHGLGSGKTCSSIAIAEGLKQNKKIIVMTPASLRMNYVQELKNCGDPLYKKQQHWEFIYLNSDSDSEQIDVIRKTLGVPIQFVKRQKGIWLVNSKKSANYDKLTSEQKLSLNKQINIMIQHKYQFISYNGLTTKRLNEMTNNGELNIFDNKVVIIDEVHNFVSRVVNKLNVGGTSSITNVAVPIYKMLLNADKCRLVFLSGTPIINYPNELAILFNMLRGYITTWEIPLNVRETGEKRKVDEAYIRNIFKPLFTTDYIAYRPSSKVVTITKNPFGFVNRQKLGEYRGVTLNERGEMSDTEFEKQMVRVLSRNQIEVAGGMRAIRSIKNKALPDDYETFKRYFLEDGGKVKNEMMFKRRILGLTSYYRSAQEQLMPEFVKDRDTKVVEIPMSDYEFGIYEKARQRERKEEENLVETKRQPDMYQDIKSSYRVFSRACCNFVFPEDIERPFPRDDAKTRASGAAGEADETAETAENPEETTDTQLVEGNEDYKARIQSALGELRRESEEVLKIKTDEDGEISYEEGLGKYSPKFANIITNIRDESKQAGHLVYSQFRAVEGIEILSMAMNANGFTRFKIEAKAGGKWKLNVDEEAVRRGDMMYALHTGTETPEEREMIRNIYNSNWEQVPTSLIRQIEKLRSTENKNIYGDIIKVFMITASGAEGISLRNTRYVHIIEPHWHPVRIEQVIGRARRICSHQDLPKELQTVEVFMYLMTIPEKYLESGMSIKMKQRDVSRLDGKTVLSSDQYLFEISRIKEEVNQQLLGAVKSSSMDCFIYAADNEAVQCMSFGDVSPNTFAYTPSIEKEQRDTIREANTKKVTWKAKALNFQGKQYAYRPDTKEVYDLDSYKQSQRNTNIQPLKIGKLVKTDKGYKIEY